VRVWVCVRVYIPLEDEINKFIRPSLSLSRARALSQSLCEDALNARPNLSLCRYLSRALSLSLSACMCKNTCGEDAFKSDSVSTIVEQAN